MKYFLCGLIILGLIAISGCALKQDHSVTSVYTEADSKLKENINQAFRCYAKDDVVTGNEYMNNVKLLYIILTILSDETDLDTANKSLEDIVEPALKRYSNLERSKIRRYSMEFLKDEQ